MSVFHFKAFSVHQNNEVHKVGTDTMILGAAIHHDKPKRILDVGTGTGVLALMMAQQFPEADIEAIDINPSAVVLAGHNFNASDYTARLTIHKGDFIHYLWESVFDLVVSNPPFFSNSLKGPKSTRNNARHDDHLPLAEFLVRVAELLTEDGAFWCVIPADRSTEYHHLAQQVGMYCAECVIIEGKEKNPIRHVLRFIKQKTNCQTSSLLVRDAGGKYTEAYKVLTKSFHGKNLDE